MRVDNNKGCHVADCSVDLNPKCPAALQGPKDSSGKVVGCKSACVAGLGDKTNNPNCCTGTHNTAKTCPPSGVAYYSYFSTSPSLSFALLSHLYETRSADDGYCSRSQRTAARTRTRTRTTSRPRLPSSRALQARRPTIPSPSAREAHIEATAACSYPRCRVPAASTAPSLCWSPRALWKGDVIGDLSPWCGGVAATARFSVDPGIRSPCLSRTASLIPYYYTIFSISHSFHCVSACLGGVQGNSKSI